MFPACRSGKINTLHLPATSDFGALLAAVFGSIAASNWISPSTFNSGSRSLAIAVALATFVARSW